VHSAKSADKKPSNSTYAARKAPRTQHHIANNDAINRGARLSRYDTPAGRHLRNLRSSADKNLAE